MRFIDLFILVTAIIIAVKASPIQERDVINADEPFDSKAFIFNPKKSKQLRTRRRKARLHKRGCCGNFGLDLNTNLKFGANSVEGSEAAAVAAPPVVVPVAPPPPPPTSNDHDTIIVNVDNKINH